MVLTRRSIGTVRNVATSATECLPGVDTPLADGTVVLGVTAVEGALASARSRLAAYPQRSQLAIASSPVSASTMNSCEELPPISPASASTALNVRPQRANILEYASYIAS